LGDIACGVAAKYQASFFVSNYNTNVLVWDVMPLKISVLLKGTYCCVTSLMISWDAIPIAMM
jgi:hypothetical protein